MTIHVILGTGAIGATLANHLAAGGHTVRVVNRSGARGALDPLIPLSQANLAHAEDAAAALAGANIVYQVTQPAYTRWEQEFPALQRSILAAAGAAGASVVLADNLYGFGPPRGATLTDDSPRLPTTRKGRVREAMAAEALAAHADGRVRVALTRPSNYVGADYQLFRQLVLDRIAKGRAAQVLGRIDQPHAFSYVPDAARAMAAIGTEDRGWGRAWITPTMEPITQRDLIARLWTALGRQGSPKIAALGRLPMRAIGVFAPVVRESIEMLYEFEEPFLVSAAQFEHEFGVTATAWDHAIEALASAAIRP